MQPIDPRIVKFIKRHHVMTLAVAKDNIPWVAHCFYCYDPDKNLFLFTSDDDTRHIRDFLGSGSREVSGGIALETSIVGKIQGIQLSGRMYLLEGEAQAEGRKRYIRRFPVAVMADLHLWGLEPNFIKFTDNRLGFGKKLTWSL